MYFTLKSSKLQWRFSCGIQTDIIIVNFHGILLYYFAAVNARLFRKCFLRQSTVNLVLRCRLFNNGAINAVKRWLRDSRLTKSQFMFSLCLCPAFTRAHARTPVRYYSIIQITVGQCWLSHSSIKLAWLTWRLSCCHTRRCSTLAL